MQVIRTVAGMKAYRRQVSGAVGLVPTMGYLHEGHLELVRNAKRGDSAGGATIFVNPTQFLPGEDFRSYPRDEARDLRLLETVNTDFVFIPTVDEMYPAGFDTWVDLGKITQRLEGAVRPGHFKGVATVVAKLFNICEPTHAYFGQKDAQQCAVVRRMVADLNMNLEIVIVPTVREPDGLAMSSRNVYLTPEERKVAPILYMSLQLAKTMRDRGERNAAVIRDRMTALLGTVPLGKVDYVSIADLETLEELEVLDRPAVVSLAFKLGKPRLIDNIILQ